MKKTEKKEKIKKKIIKALSQGDAAKNIQKLRRLIEQQIQDAPRQKTEGEPIVYLAPKYKLEAQKQGAKYQRAQQHKKFAPMLQQLHEEIKKQKQEKQQQEQKQRQEGEKLKKVFLEQINKKTPRQVARIEVIGRFAVPFIKQNLDMFDEFKAIQGSKMVDKEDEENVLSYLQQAIDLPLQILRNLRHSMEEKKEEGDEPERQLIISLSNVINRIQSSMTKGFKQAAEQIEKQKKELPELLNKLQEGAEVFLYDPNFFDEYQKQIKQQKGNEQKAKEINEAPEYENFSEQVHQGPTVPLGEIRKEYDKMMKNINEKMVEEIAKKNEQIKQQREQKKRDQPEVEDLSSIFDDLGNLQKLEKEEQKIQQSQLKIQKALQTDNIEQKTNLMKNVQKQQKLKQSQETIQKTASLREKQEKGEITREESLKILSELIDQNIKKQGIQVKQIAQKIKEQKQKLIDKLAENISEVAQIEQKQGQTQHKKEDTKEDTKEETKQAANPEKTTTQQQTTTTPQQTTTTQQQDTGQQKDQNQGGTGKNQSKKKKAINFATLIL